jgi:hypothetical protein
VEIDEMLAGVDLAEIKLEGRFGSERDQHKALLSKRLVERKQKIATIKARKQQLVSEREWQERVDRELENEAIRLRQKEQEAQEASQLWEQQLKERQEAEAEELRVKGKEFLAIQIGGLNEEADENKMKIENRQRELADEQQNLLKQKLEKRQNDLARKRRDLERKQAAKKELSLKAEEEKEVLERDEREMATDTARRNMNMSKFAAKARTKLARVRSKVPSSKGE